MRGIISNDAIIRNQSTDSGHRKREVPLPPPSKSVSGNIEGKCSLSDGHNGFHEGQF